DGTGSFSARDRAERMSGLRADHFRIRSERARSVDSRSPCLSRAIRQCRLYRRASTSDVQIPDKLRVFLDEQLARLDLIAHQLLKEVGGANRVLQLDLEDRPARGVHGGFPELVGIHLPEALVAL